MHHDRKQAGPPSQPWAPCAVQTASLRSAARHSDRRRTPSELRKLALALFFAERFSRRAPQVVIASIYIILVYPWSRQHPSAVVAASCILYRTVCSHPGRALSQSLHKRPHSGTDSQSSVEVRTFCSNLIDFCSTLDCIMIFLCFC